MLRNLILALSLLIASPCFASDGTTPIIVFMNHDTVGDQIVTAKSSNYSSPNDVCDFTPTNGDTIPSHYSNNYPSPGYTYSYVPPAPPVVPNAQAFVVAIGLDPLTTANNYALLFNLSGLLATFQADMQTIPFVGGPSVLQAHWAAAIVNFGSTWLTSPVQTMILNYAALYNIPLVP